MQSFDPEFQFRSAHEWRQRDMLRVLNRFLAAQGMEPWR